MQDEYPSPLKYLDGSIGWILQGRFHREDGPAIIHPTGESYWFIYGRELLFDDYCQELKLTEQAIIVLKLQYDVNKSMI